MVEWEYLVIETTESYANEYVEVKEINEARIPKNERRKLIPYLQEIGKEGWELVAKDGFNYFFKRPKE